MNKKNGLTDAEKIIVTVAIWIASVSVFATALSLDMLPDDVTIFFRPADAAHAVYYSKLYNLLLLCVAAVPDGIILAAASLKRHGRLQNNFLSIILFSIMLSLCVDGIIIYGIIWQFAASEHAERININALICILSAFLISITSGTLPAIIHEPTSKPSEPRREKSATANNIAAVAVSDWFVGVYWFLLCAVVCSFVPSYFCYIPLGVMTAAFAVYFAVRVKKCPPER